MRRIAKPLVPAVMVLSILLAACARLGGTPGLIEHPTGDEVVFRIAYSGGFAGPAFQFTSFPGFTLSGDGRIIVPGAQIEIFPGPALPAVNVRRLTEAGIQAVLNEIAGTALFGASAEYRGAQNCVMDASDTTFILDAFGSDVNIVVYGLGTLDAAGQCPGFTTSESAAHGTLQNLSNRLMNLDAWLDEGMWAETDWRPFQPEALRLLVRNADADLPDDSGISNGLLDWPDASDPATFGDPTGYGEERCDVVSGQAARDWHAALSGANQLTRFVSGGHRYQVTVRFLLPDDLRECPQLPA